MIIFSRINIILKQSNIQYGIHADFSLADVSEVYLQDWIKMNGLYLQQYINLLFMSYYGWYYHLVHPNLNKIIDF